MEPTQSTFGEHSDNPLLNAALDYLSRGWSAFPLTPRDKTPWPLFPVKTYQRDRRATEAELRHFWKRVSQSNLAIATGQISGLFVWDCDTPQAFKATLWHGIPDTAIAQTGKGFHVYFSYPNFPVGNRVKPLPDVDIRGDGGYVVAPPSVHPSGAGYEWINDLPLQPAPEWILDVVRLTKHREAPVTHNATEIRYKTAYGAAALQSEAQQVAATGSGRNARLYRAALKMGSLIADGRLDYETVVRTLLSAATANGYVAKDGETQAWKTILSGINTGMENSRERYIKTNRQA